jgi:hypothetical protein
LSTRTSFNTIKKDIEGKKGPKSRLLKEQPNDYMGKLDDVKMIRKNLI